jgi:hypothetical protein
MSRCATCKFWDVGSDDRHLASLMLELGGWRTCLKMSGDCLQPTYPPTQAMAYETGERESRVMTSPEFGCVMFEANGATT